MTRNDHEDGQADKSGFRNRHSRSWSMNSNNINNSRSHLNNYNNNNNSMSGTYHTNSNRHDTPPTRNNNNTSHYNPSASNPYPSEQQHQHRNRIHAAHTTNINNRRFSHDKGDDHSSESIRPSLQRKPSHDETDYARKKRMRTFSPDNINSNHKREQYRPNSTPHQRRALPPQDEIMPSTSRKGQYQGRHDSNTNHNNGHNDNRNWPRTGASAEHAHDARMGHLTSNNDSRLREKSDHHNSAGGKGVANSNLIALGQRKSSTDHHISHSGSTSSNKGNNNNYHFNAGSHRNDSASPRTYGSSGFKPPTPDMRSPRDGSRTPHHASSQSPGRRPSYGERRPFSSPSPARSDRRPSLQHTHRDHVYEMPSVQAPKIAINDNVHLNQGGSYTLAPSSQQFSSSPTITMPKAVEKAIAAAAAVLEMPSLITPQQSPSIKNRYTIASAMIPPTTQTTTAMILWPTDMEGRAGTTSMPASTLSTAPAINTVVSESPYISGNDVNDVNVLPGASSLHLTTMGNANPTARVESEMSEGYLNMGRLTEDKGVRIPDTSALNVFKKLDSSLQQPLTTGAEETTVYTVHTIRPEDDKAESATPESIPSERVPLTEQQLRILSDPVTTRLLEAIQPWLSQNTHPAATMQPLQSDSGPKSFGDKAALLGSVHEEDAEHPGMSKDGGSKVDMSADGLSRSDQDTDGGLAGMSKDGNDNTDVSTNLDLSKGTDVSKSMNVLESTGDTTDGVMEDGAMERGSDADMSIDIPESTLSSVIYSQDSMSQALLDSDDRQATSISQLGDEGHGMILIAAGEGDALDTKSETDFVEPLDKTPLDTTVLNVAASSQDLPTDLFVTALLGSLTAAPTNIGDLAVSDTNVSETTFVRESDRPVATPMESASMESKFRGSASPRDESMEDTQVLVKVPPEQSPMKEPLDDMPVNVEDAAIPSKNENNTDVLQAKVQSNVTVEPQAAEILLPESVSNRVVEPEPETKPQTKPETEKKPEKEKKPESEPEMGDLAESISDVEAEGPQTVPDVEASSFAESAESRQEPGSGNKGNAVKPRPRSLTTPSSSSYPSARSSSHRGGPGPQPYASWHFVPGSDLAFLSEMQASNADLKRFRRESQWLEERVCRPKRDTTSDQILDKALGLTKTVRHPPPGRDVSAPSRPTKQDNLSDNKALATAVRLSADTRLAISMVKSQLQEDWEEHMRLEVDQATLHRTLARTQIRIEETQRLEEQAEQQMKEMTAKQTEREQELERVRNLERTCLEMKEKQRIQAEKEIWQLETTLKQLQEQQGSTPTPTMTPTSAASTAIRDQPWHNMI